MKSLPIGEQHLETFIEDDLIYVDKTQLIHQLITTERRYFFSRPRRFGKSLLVDTIRQIFLGNAEFDINRRFDVYTLMFQTGYITIKVMDESHIPIRYTLGYPNEEVRRAFVIQLLEIYTYQEATTVSTVVLEVEEALQQGDIDAFEEQLNILFADISYQLFPFEKKDKTKIRAHQEFVAWEGYFQTVIEIQTRRCCCRFAANQRPKIRSFLPQ